MATAVTSLAILALALLFPLEDLAEAASALTLAVFALVNTALLVLKRRGPPPARALEVPGWVPLAGLLISSGFVLGELRSLLP